jgi:hypothetical protein
MVRRSALAANSSISPVNYNLCGGRADPADKRRQAEFGTAEANEAA